MFILIADNLLIKYVTFRNLTTDENVVYHRHHLNVLCPNVFAASVALPTIIRYAMAVELQSCTFVAGIFKSVFLLCNVIIVVTLTSLTKSIS